MVKYNFEKKNCVNRILSYKISKTKAPKIMRACAQPQILTSVGFSRATFAREQMLRHFIANESVGFALEAHLLDFVGNVFARQYR